MNNIKIKRGSKIYKLPTIASFVIAEIPAETILTRCDTDVEIFGWYKVKTSDEKIGFIQREYCEGIECELSEKEKGFLITCIMSAASEKFTSFPRYNKKFSPETGIKYEGISSKTEIIDLIKKLGGDEDDLNELFFYL